MTDPLKVQIAHFDTDVIQQDLRLEAWHQNMGVLFDLSSSDGKQQDNHQISAAIDVCTFGETVFGTTRANSQLFDRSTQRIVQDDLDHILLQVFMSGGGVTVDKQEISAGDMLVIDLNQPHKMLNSDFKNLTLVLPRNVHPELADLLSPMHGKRLMGHNPVIRLMAQHLVLLWQNVPEMSVAQASATLHESLNLLQRTLLRELNVQETQQGGSGELTKMIRRYIESHLADALTPDALARMFGISRSQLYRMFAEDGGVARYIWERRLQRAMRMLCLHQFKHLPIVAIAFEIGFSSEAHFSRVFKARFGRPPGQARADAMAQIAQVEDGEGANNNQGYGTDLADWIRKL